MPIQEGVFTVKIQFQPSGNLMHPLPTQQQVKDAILKGCADTGLPTPLQVGVE